MLLSPNYFVPNPIGKPVLSHMETVLSTGSSNEDAARCILICLSNALRACDDGDIDHSTIIGLSSLAPLLQSFGVNKIYALETRHRAITLMRQFLLVPPLRDACFKSGLNRQRVARELLQSAQQQPHRLGSIAKAAAEAIGFGEMK